MGNLLGIMKKFLLRASLGRGAATVGCGGDRGARRVCVPRPRAGLLARLKIDAAKSRADLRPLRVGFGRVKISPDLSDPQTTDVDGRL
jgi:hypothetical protein